MARETNEGNSFVDQAFEASNHQKNNLWDFRIQKNDESEWPFVAKVKAASLPFISLTTETRNTGEKHYTGFTPIETLSITIYESTEFSTYSYFKEWMDQVFDERLGTFVSLDSGIEKGSNEDTLHRTGFLTFESFEKVEGEVEELVLQEFQKEFGPEQISYKEAKRAIRESIRKRDYSVPLIKTITTKEILGNIFTAAGRQVVQTAVGSANNVANKARRLTGRPTKAAPELPPPPTRKRYDVLTSPIDYKFDIELVSQAPTKLNTVQRLERIAERLEKQVTDIQVSKWQTRETKVFKYENLKILGLSELSLSYDSGEALEYTINLTADRIIPVE